MFSRSNRLAMVRASARPASTGLSFIGAEVMVAGNIKADGDIHVDGQIEGDINCIALIQGDSGRIMGGIVADHARIAGMVDGSIEARELFLSATARVTGDIAYQSLSIETGAQVAGRFTHRPAPEEADTASLKLIATAAG